MRVPTVGGPAACPVCRAPGRRSERYPAALCPACVERLVDGEGRAVALFNTDPLGHGLRIETGIDAVEGTAAETLPLFCDGVECRAREARFGGVVVEPRAAWEDG